MCKMICCKSVISRICFLTSQAFFRVTQVIVVEDENGNVVRETMKDNDVLAQYRTMREILIY